MGAYEHTWHKLHVYLLMPRWTCRWCSKTLPFPAAMKSHSGHFQSSSLLWTASMWAFSLPSCWSRVWSFLNTQFLYRFLSLNFGFRTSDSSRIHERRPGSTSHTHWTLENPALPVWPVKSEDIVATVVNRRFQFWYHFCPRPPSQSWWSWGLWFFGLLWKISWVRGIHYCAPKLVCLYKRKEACQISTP